ncbi:hypothetical protein AB0O31_03250 [Kitasatospora cineracea]|uniref:hypothetical protein n=1 Tax=Kitasatospora cineracea TaxID=88074 RepID=UPI003435BF6D
MTREHAPHPGATWESTARPVEQLVEDGQPEPRPNRAARRAAARADRTNACRIFDFDGTPVRLAGGTAELDARARQHLAEIVAAAKRRYEAATATDGPSAPR